MLSNATRIFLYNESSLASRWLVKKWRDYCWPFACATTQMHVTALITRNYDALAKHSLAAAVPQINYDECQSSFRFLARCITGAIASLYMFLYIHICVFMYIYIYIYMYMYTCTQTHTNTHTYTHTCLHLCTIIFTHIYTWNTCVHEYVHIPVCTYQYRYTHIYYPTVQKMNA